MDALRHTAWTARRIVALAMAAILVAPTVAFAVPPVSTITISPADYNGEAGWWITAPTIQLSSDQDGRVFYSYDGGPETPVTVLAGVPVSIGEPPSEGSRLLSAYAVNSVGDTETPGVSRWIDWDITAPTQPTGLGGVASSTDSVILSWTASSDGASGVEEYVVYRSDVGLPYEWVEVDRSDSTTYEDGTAVPGAKYHYMVQAWDTAGNRSVNSESEVVVADGTPPTTPGSFRAGRSSAGAVTLRWNASNDGGTGVASYAIERNVDEAGWTGVATLEPTLVEWADPSPASGGSVSYRIRALDGVGLTSEWAGPATLPPAPGWFTAWRNAAGLVRLGWTAPPASGQGLTGYVIERDVDEAGWSRVPTLAPEALSWTDPAPAVSATVTYRIAAVDAAELLSDWTGPVPLRLDAQPPHTTSNVGLLASQPMLVLEAGDADSGVATVWYALDGGPAQAYEGPVPLWRGVHSVTWWARDVAGNTEAAHSGTIISGPQPYVSTPRGRSSVRVRGSLTFSGKLSRVGNHTRLTLLAYRWDGADWVFARAKNVKVHTPRRRGSATYSGSIKFTAKGSWKVVARYEGDGYWVQSFSSPKYVRVR